MNILIIGSTGMLGNMVGASLIKKYGEENIYLTYRDLSISYGKNKIYFDPLNNKNIEEYNLECLFDKMEQVDWVINCLGKIKPFVKNNTIETIKINSIFPRILSNICEKMESKLIHITTDCVFSGKKGNYTEADPHDALDVYGKSKSLGEPENCMVIRTSIIGEEIHKNASLVEWAKSQKDKTINGFTNHFWNGITTREYASICSQIIDTNLYETGVFHLFSNSVTKYELLNLLNKKFNLNLTINKTEANESINRTLSTIKSLQKKIKIKTLEEQITEM